MHIIGASGHAKVIIDILECQGKMISSVWDDNKAQASFEGYTVSGTVKDINVADGAEAIIAIGNNKVRKKIASSIDAGYGQAIHPSANISKRSSISIGTVVMAGVSINAGTTIGQHAIINTNSSIDHDCILGDFVHVSPNAALAGNVSVGEGSHIGIGACIIQGIKIGKWATIGAGAVIIKDVPDYATVVGSPGKIIKINTTGNNE
jgi:sugar O-acyltransferase (sialic acid O-acetyltransferase NeuD family)